MNNSFERLIDGMIEALRNSVIPHTEGEFARGQAFGIIFMLKSIKARAAWSSEFLGEQVAALDALAETLGSIEGYPSDAPRLLYSTHVSEATRDAGDAAVSSLIDWLAKHADTLSPVVSMETNSAVDAYLKRQLRHEITTSPRPMFAEISLGHE